LGRIITGAVFDAFGRRVTMIGANLITILSAGLTLLAVSVHSLPLCIAGLCLTGMSYGATPTVCSAFVSAFYGQKHFATNYSIINFTLMAASFIATACNALLAASGAYVAPFALLLTLACGALILNLPGGQVKLETEDLLISIAQKDGYYSAKVKGYTVVLDIQLSDALIREGFIREIISKIQTMRKDSGFEVTDRIDVRYTCGDVLDAAIQAGLDMIKNGTLALTVEKAEADDSFIAKDWNINGQKAVLAVRVHK
jgi:MFS family permease